MFGAQISPSFAIVYNQFIDKRPIFIIRKFNSHLEWIVEKMFVSLANKMYFKIADAFSKLSKKFKKSRDRSLGYTLFRVKNEELA